MDNSRDERGEEPRAQPDEKLVELVKVQGDFEAQVIKGMLECEGIEVEVRPGVSQNILPMTVDGLGQAKLYVRESDLEEAKAILEEYRRPE